ncbi:Type IV pilus assembly PilZ domain protein [Candidatus Magnetoovum chiemensis]|nr:Type IV pilus assembly PilZ domain protein [Candidatus Magnetoovum chiemensis]
MRKSSKVKKVSVYPSAQMTIPCPHCEFKGKITLANPPTDDFSATCPKCKNKFRVILNKRQYYRKSINIPVYHSSLDSTKYGGKKLKEGIILDISQGGLLVEHIKRTGEPVYEKEGSKLTLTFKLNNNKIEVQGLIVRVTEIEKNKLRIGVRFIELDIHASHVIGFFLMP